MIVTNGAEPRSSAPSFRLEALSVAIEATVLESWVRRAKPGEKIVYASGFAPPRMAAAFQLARELAGVGLIDLHNPRREGGGFEWVARRRAASVEPPPAEQPALPDHIADKILNILAEAARRGTPCPTDAEFAEELELPNADAASYRIRKLVARGEIEIARPSWRERRVVTIVATGQRTIRAPLALRASV